ncbi:MAG: arginine decarboxylase [Leptolyngbya foveolarum]|uniref:Arginine decarboxylase n=1 Tax=Leptolyngbya foveolarum TaxID=47253 RepID=A0A2W4UGF0_9CYAN|nr:MAG: arginine decarboxylase [Leptolyngbya foveolarum]
MDQSATPLIDALKHCATRDNAAFYTPGHKRGQGLSPKHRDLFGTQVFRTDLPELPELDNLFAPEGVILQAQALAAEAFGADRTWFLVNGSTCGIEAAILATCGPGDQLILPRNVHSSAISGLILSGATPIYVEPDYSEAWDMPIGVSPQTIERAIAHHPTAKAVLLVSPTYQGICSDIEAIAHITQAHNIPLIIDEAHGPHFAFHPDLPTSALTAGADLVIQSAHKVLSAFTQSALLHVQGDRINRHRLTQSLQLTQSTSPSYLLLGSLDAARHQMVTNGLTLMEKTIELADQAFREISRLPGLKVLQPRRDLDELVGDRTRLTVDVSPLGLTGFAADEILHRKFNVTAELPTLKHLTFIISLGNTSADIDNLIYGFEQLCELHPPKLQEVKNQYTRGLSVAEVQTHRAHLQSGFGYAQPSVTPRQAFFSPKLSLPLTQAPGHISTETICPYPPGIPVLLPGELITEGAIAHLQTLQAAGAILTGCQDPQLKTILVVDPSALTP